MVTIKASELALQLRHRHDHLSSRQNQNKIRSVRMSNVDMQTFKFKCDQILVLNGIQKVYTVVGSGTRTL